MFFKKSSAQKIRNNKTKTEGRTKQPKVNKETPTWKIES